MSFAAMLFHDPMTQLELESAEMKSDASDQLDLMDLVHQRTQGTPAVFHSDVPMQAT